MKELARSRIKDNKITIPPNIMDRLLLENNDRISFFEHRGRIIIKKYREGNGDPEREEEVKSSDFNVEFETGSSSSQAFPFNPLDPAFQENFKSAFSKILENEETREMMRKTAEDLSKNLGKMFEGVFSEQETIDLEKLDPDQETGDRKTDPGERDL
ncbi:MAG: hypothetical protein ACTSP4_09025, partial [Candidatus Hodarchaeales archaeon]